MRYVVTYITYIARCTEKHYNILSTSRYMIFVFHQSSEKDNSTTVIPKLDKNHLSNQRHV